jgi:hypothetical protein
VQEVNSSCCILKFSLLMFQVLCILNVFSISDFSVSFILQFYPLCKNTFPTMLAAKGVLRGA